MRRYMTLTNDQGDLDEKNQRYDLREERDPATDRQTRFIS